MNFNEKERIEDYCDYCKSLVRDYFIFPLDSGKNQACICENCYKDFVEPYIRRNMYERVVTNIL